MKPKIKAKVGIFDHSGVIVDDLKTVLYATNKILSHYNKPILTIDEIKEVITFDFVAYWKSKGLDYHKDRIQEKFDYYYAQESKNTKAFDFAKDSLDKILRKVPTLGICSSQTNETVNRELREFNLFGLFNPAYIKGSSRGVNGKSQALKNIISMYGLKPSQVFFVGDMDQDIDQGNKAGVIPIGVLSGYHNKERLEKQKPYEIIKDISELPNLLE